MDGLEDVQGANSDDESPVINARPVYAVL